MRSASQALVEFVAEFEGFRPDLYNDPAGHATIGFGHLVHTGPINGSEPDAFKRGLTREQALELLRSDLRRFEAAVSEVVRVTLAQHQFDALVSFTFNVGEGALRGSDLLSRLNRGEIDAVPGELGRWNRGTVNGKKVVLKGLTRRREREGLIFRHGIYKEGGAPERVEEQQPERQPDRRLQKTFFIAGIARDESGAPVERAVVQIVGSEEQLGGVARAVVSRPRGELHWSRVISGFAGNRWNLWQKFVMNQVAGISWSEFKDQVVEHNPSIASDNGILRATESYRLPEQVAELPVIEWDRPLTTFSGNRWSCWIEHVQGKIEGLTWSTFLNEVVARNPSLREDGFVFSAVKQYVLPRNVPDKPYVAWTRTRSGLSGSRWNQWESEVRGQVEGITWDQFREAVVEHNPSLAADGFVFLPGNTYRLPENAPRPRYYLSAVTDGAGRYLIDGLLAPGDYDLVAEASGFQRLRQRIALQAETTKDVVLSPVVVEDAEQERRVVDRNTFVQASGTEFRLHGAPFRFIGVNIRGLAHYGDKRHQLLRHSEPADRARQLDAARDLGARVVRLFLANAHSDTSETIAALEEVLRLAAERNQYLIVSFTDAHSDVGFFLRGDQQFYSPVPDFRDMLSLDFYTGGFRENYLPFVESVVSHFRDHPNIFAWELGNEMKAQEPRGDHIVFHPERFIAFAHEVAGRIRALDPNHLITTGIISSRNLNCSDEQKERLYRSPNLDFLTVHAYDGDDFEDDSPVARAVGKPLIIEEAGFSSDDRAQRTDQDIAKWLGQREARGYLQWGFMATDGDIGDGDDHRGISRFFNPDHWHRWFETTQRWAATLKGS